MRAQVVVLEGDRVLMARHTCPDREYWVLPGGAVEPGETPEGAAIREMQEETGLRVVLERLLFVDEPREVGPVRITQPRYTFLASVAGGSLNCPDGETGNPGNGHLSGCEWLAFDDGRFDGATRDTLARVAGTLR